jgi:hypothetical protein
MISSLIFTMINRYLRIANKNVTRFFRVLKWIPAFAGMTMYAEMIYAG